VQPPRPLPPEALGDLEVKVDGDTIRIGPRTPLVPPEPPAPGSSAPPLPPSRIPRIEIPLPADPADREEIREAIEEAKEEIREALRGEPRVRTVKAFTPGEYLPQLAMLLIVASILVKVMFTGQRKAEARAAAATELAEGEALKRQVVEARMAAMQAQVEPHFLFNTLASIDHLIETDPPRASQMQKHLIALLRASMPTMRETANAGAPRDLGRELAVVKPYVEILTMRMEERLQATIDVPDGLLSAEFPPMMMQSLVENAVKHGLEPKPAGGTLLVKAEIVHGKLAVTVADTGLGFGKAAGTAGTGTGLANIRERLQLLYGTKATLTVAENRPSGTRVTITVPYVAHTQEDAA
jgi:LytS/YehU family sensor histidine kinase